MPVITPERTVDQRMSALAEANRIRTLRAELKRTIKAGGVCGRDLIASPGADLETMKVIDLLVAMPKWGRVKSSTALKRAGVSPSKTLGGLSERQRVSLLVWLPR